MIGRSQQVLGLLMNRPRYGQEIAIKCGVTRGAAYALLKRLETRGLIAREPKENSSLRPGASRIYYTVTAKGSRMYSAMELLE